MAKAAHFKVGKDHMNIEEAFDEIRKLPTNIDKIIEIVGDLVLDGPIELSSHDSGLTLLGGRIIGGVRLDKWETDPRDGRFVRAKLPEGATPRSLSINGTARRIAVYPADGFLKLNDEPENLKWLNSVNGGWNRALTDYELTHVHMDPDNIPIGAIDGSAEIRVYHSWDESTVPIKSIDRLRGEITLCSPMTHPAGSFAQKDVQFINLREGMTECGAWYFDAAEGYVYYYPKSGEQIVSAAVPMQESLIRIKGARNITVRDTELSDCSAPRVSSGLRSANLGGVIEIENSERIFLSGLNIHDASGHGIKLTGVKGHRIENCKIYNMGGGGIFTHASEDEEISGNEITDIGLFAYSSVGIHAGGRSMLVWVLEGKPRERGKTIIRGNRVERVPYCAITCNGRGHVIEDNTVVDFMQRLHDGAGIYVSRGRRTVVRRNYAKSALCGRPNKSYYFDEGGYRCICEGNVSLGVESACGDHRCRRMTVRNNRFESDRELYLVLNNCRDYKILNNSFKSGGRFIIAVPQDGIEDVDKLVLYLKKYFRFKNNTVTAPDTEPCVVGYGETVSAPEIKIN